MSTSNVAPVVPPFPRGYRASGLLLHITSLPSAYGIGDLGPGAFEWVQRLHEAGQRWWQALPLGPTGCFNSPYQCLSSFIGNGLLISPEFLIEDGLLSAKECEGEFPAAAVDYDAVIPFKHRLLDAAWKRFEAGARNDLRPEYEEFCRDRGSWLDDYALFRALKNKFKGACYLDWPAELVRRNPDALVQARQSMAGEVEKVRVAQFLLFRQARRLKEYARSRGVHLIGDLPFFVSPDSSDVWAHPELFLLDEYCRPRFVGGVPPDYFSKTGQLWGNPVYDWAALGRTGYAWWIERIRALLAHVEVIRLDHFRGFAAAWHVAAGAETAETGHWEPGPGAAFFSLIQKELGGLPFIAEDLGLITPDVTSLLKEFRVPGTRVLQFAFDGNPGNPHLPEAYSTNLVVYTGTHDNPTTREWFEELAPPDQQRVWSYLRRSGGKVHEVAGELIRVAWWSRAAIAIAPLQDLLNLGSEGRMNVPGRAEGNWNWRTTPRMLKPWNFHWLRDLTNSVNRSAAFQDRAKVAS